MRKFAFVEESNEVVHCSLDRYFAIYASRFKEIELLDGPKSALNVVNTCPETFQAINESSIVKVSGPRGFSLRAIRRHVTKASFN